MSVFFDAAVFGTVVQWGALESPVMLNAPTEDVLGGRVSSNEYELIAPVGVFPGVNAGDTMVVTAGQYEGS